MTFYHEDSILPNLKKSFQQDFNQNLNEMCLESDKMILLFIQTLKTCKSNKEKLDKGNEILDTKKYNKVFIPYIVQSWNQ